MQVDLEIPELDLEIYQRCPKCFVVRNNEVKNKTKNPIECKFCESGFIQVPTDFGKDLLNFLDKYYVRK